MCAKGFTLIPADQKSLYIIHIVYIEEAKNK